MSELLELLKQLQAIAPEKVLFEDNHIPEIVPFPTLDFSFSMIETSDWTPSWDILRGTVERWAIAEGIRPGSGYANGLFIARMEVAGLGVFVESDTEPTIAILSAYIQAKVSQKKEAA